MGRRGNQNFTPAELDEVIHRLEEDIKMVQAHIIQNPYNTHNKVWKKQVRKWKEELDRLLFLRENIYREDK